MKITKQQLYEIIIEETINEVRLHKRQTLLEGKMSDIAKTFFKVADDVATSMSKLYVLTAKTNKGKLNAEDLLTVKVKEIMGQYDDLAAAMATVANPKTTVALGLDIFKWSREYDTLYESVFTQFEMLLKATMTSKTHAIKLKRAYETGGTPSAVLVGKSKKLLDQISELETNLIKMKKQFLESDKWNAIDVAFMSWVLNAGGGTSITKGGAAVSQADALSSRWGTILDSWTKLFLKKPTRQLAQMQAARTRGDTEAVAALTKNRAFAQRFGSLTWQKFAIGTVLSYFGKKHVQRLWDVMCGDADEDSNICGVLTHRFVFGAAAAVAYAVGGLHGAAVGGVIGGVVSWFDFTEEAAAFQAAENRAEILKGATQEKLEEKLNELIALQFVVSRYDSLAAKGDDSTGTEHVRALKNFLYKNTTQLAKSAGHILSNDPDSVWADNWDKALKSVSSEKAEPSAREKELKTQLAKAQFRSVALQSWYNWMEKSDFEWFFAKGRSFGAPTVTKGGDTETVDTDKQKNLMCKELKLRSSHEFVKFYNKAGDGAKDLKALGLKFLAWKKGSGPESSDEETADDGKFVLKAGPPYGAKQIVEFCKENWFFNVDKMFFRMKKYLEVNEPMALRQAINIASKAVIDKLDYEVTVETHKFKKPKEEK